MADPGNLRAAPLQGWQRANVVAAASYLRELIAFAPEDPKLHAAYEGLLDLLDPSRIAVRRQRELADSATRAASAMQERRHRERRRQGDRRVANLGPPGGVERRRGGDRRTGRDRRR